MKHGQQRSRPTRDLLYSWYARSSPLGVAVVVDAAAAAASAGTARVEDRPKRHVPIVTIMVLCRLDVAAVVVLFWWRYEHDVERTRMHPNI